MIKEQTMHPNPVLRKLGLADDDRAVIIHTDDIGMCQASLAAFADLVEFGLISSGATMVPCPWFPQVAAYCRTHPRDFAARQASVDLGVHLTLTCEWDTYRWGPISTRAPASGMIDEEGYFYRQSEPVQEHGDPATVQIELLAQVERALKAGIDVTHVDTHMGTVMHQKFIPVYLQVAAHYRLPPMLPRWDQAHLHEMSMDAETAAFAARMLQELEAQGVPMFDHMAMMPLDEPAHRVETAKRLFDALPPGLSYFILHPAQDTPELRAIAPDWLNRVADYEAFTSPELRDYVKGSGIHVIGYRALRDLMRAQG
jgi:predicted glycoside hydrolase/deacetylase ChbG (UPF0249 family)